MLNPHLLVCHSAITLRFLFNSLGFVLVLLHDDWHCETVNFLYSLFKLIMDMLSKMGPTLVLQQPTGNTQPVKGFYLFLSSLLSARDLCEDLPSCPRNT